MQQITSAMDTLIYIGVAGCNQFYYKGLIDDARIYTRALSATEITALAAGTHTSATWTGGTSTNYETASNWDISAVPDPYTKIVIGTGSFQPTMTANESVAGLTTNSSTTLTLAGFNLTMNDSGTFSNNGTLTLQGAETLTGLTNDTDSGTITYNGSSSYSSLDLGNTYYNLTFNGSGTWSPSSALTVNGALTNSAGTYNANGQTTTVTGLATVAGGTYSASTATQTFNGGLTVSGGTFTGSSGAIDVNGTLTISSGILTAPSGNFTVSGNWANSGGTFTPGTNTVTLDGTSQTLTGATTFYNLTKSVTSSDTLTFPASTTQTITNTLTLNGAASNLLALRSSSFGTQWNFDPQGTRTFSYLNPQDSNNINSTAIAYDSTFTYGTNLTNWTLPASSSSSSSSSSSISSSTACNSSAPSGTPDLFQIDAGQNSATLHFTTVNGASGYQISFGSDPNANQFGDSVSYSGPQWTLDRQINSLNSNTTYYFKIKAMNGCNGGNFSKTVSAITTSGNQGGLVDQVVSDISQNIEDKKLDIVSSDLKPTDSGTEKVGQEGYNLDIKVADKGKPLVGVKVTLHSKIQVAITNQDGIVHFQGVEKGEHKVVLSLNGSTGEQTFNLSGDNKNQTLSIEVKLSNDFASPRAIAVIVVMGVIIAVLLFLLLKKRQK